MKFWLFLACSWLVVGQLVRADAAEEDDDESEEQPKRLVVYYNFEKILKPKIITDKSGYENSGTMTQGGEILKFSDEDYTCSQGARLWEAAINFKGDTFQAKPRTAITVAAWVRLEKRQGQHSIFDTVGVSHPKGQYHFEVNNGIVRWFHRDQTEKVVFETMAHTVEKGKWTHLAGTYDSKTKQAKIFINGEIRNQSIGDGLLSRDWSVHAGISNMLKCRPLQGSIDEFRIYNYALTPDEIKALVSACKAPDAAASTKTLSAETTDKAEARSETPKENESDSTSDKKTERKRRSLIDLTIRRLNFT
ncbi:uncharacterized protein [Clytia hemisphaerica]